PEKFPEAALCSVALSDQVDCLLAAVRAPHAAGVRKVACVAPKLYTEKTVPELMASWYGNETAATIDMSYYAVPGHDGRKWRHGSETTRYCVVKRSKEPGKGKWSLPGGSVELGEETLLAAAREAREETSLSKEDLRFYPHAVCTTDAIYRREDGARGFLFHYVITHQAAWITTGAMDRARAGDDAAELTFKTLEELKAMSLEGLLVGNVCDVVMRVERLVAKGVINIEFDLVRLEA
ncbi:hypothetical protein NGA_0502900, partial [Nannochloropsis gaditana CCMP526]|uniref:uncharacterized protein n=1 Tax=Nannochloropsis gaditana (strain CCMP526) TaxID=1093141 RepID=UPI00029F790F